MKEKKSLSKLYYLITPLPDITGGYIDSGLKVNSHNFSGDNRTRR